MYDREGEIFNTNSNHVTTFSSTSQCAEYETKYFRKRNNNYITVPFGM